MALGCEKAGRGSQRPEAARGSQRHSIPAAIAPFSSRHRRTGAGGWVASALSSGEHIGSAVHARLEDHGTAPLVQRPPSALSGHGERWTGGHDRRVRHPIGVVGQKDRGSIEAGVSGRCQHEDDSPHPAKRRARPLPASPDTAHPAHPTRRPPLVGSPSPA
jgi:hypothetical protein